MNSESIVHLADLLAASRGWSRATVSTYSTKSGDAIERLARGHDITTRRAGRIAQWLSDHWPVDLEWPADIPRPDLAPDSPAAQAAAPPPVNGDRVAAVQATIDRMDAAVLAGDWDAARTAEEAKFTAALQLGVDGRIASVRALCLALGMHRHVYDDVVHRYAGGRSGSKPRSGSQVERMLTALVAARDVRFASRRPRGA